MDKPDLTIWFPHFQDLIEKQEEQIKEIRQQLEKSEKALAHVRAMIAMVKKSLDD